jgi:hypothetical protein
LGFLVLDSAGFAHHLFLCVLDLLFVFVFYSVVSFLPSFLSLLLVAVGFCFGCERFVAVVELLLIVLLAFWDCFFFFLPFFVGVVVCFGGGGD